MTQTQNAKTWNYTLETLEATLLRYGYLQGVVNILVEAASEVPGGSVFQAMGIEFRIEYDDVADCYLVSRKR